MKSHRKIIVDNLSAHKYSTLSFDFLVQITNESERGAILIGGSKVDEYLENLILNIIPQKSKDYQNRLLKYPGPLSSFSGKIELLHAFNIIDEQLYNSLNTLRKIRNDAAHSSKDFSIQNIQDKLDTIYEVEDGFKDVAYDLAFENLMKFKKESFKKLLEDGGLATEYDYEKLWSEGVPDPENNKIIQEHLTIWKFSYGLLFLCLKIEAVTIEYNQNKMTTYRLKSADKL